jgi:asparagine synthase (glutamine-hydrolysing)
MCGIAGVLGGSVDPASLDAACGAMTHRGPDGASTWSGPQVGLAHTRLAIIDRAGGAQPMLTPDGRFVVVFNGEIYNHRDLRRELEAHGVRFRTSSDTEVLLQLYARYGATMVERLRGMFAFAVVDLLERTALLARDRFGKKPLCYRDWDGTFAFASTLDGLRPLMPATPTVDIAAIAQYLVLQYVPAPLTAWVGVRKLPPGHLAEWKDGSLTVRRYWEPPPRDGSPTQIEGSDGAVARVRELIRDAVTVRLESEVPLGVFLSGGLDSSVVVAELAAAGMTPATYSVGFKDAAFDESGYAQVVAERFGTEHHALIADDDPARLFEELTRVYDEPFADSSALATLAVAKVAREHVTVILTGDGGDEMFGGYARYAAFRRARRLGRRLGSLTRPAVFGARVAGRLLGNRVLGAGSHWVADPWGGYRDALFHFPPDRMPSLLREDALDGIDPRAPVADLDGLWRRSGHGTAGLLWVDEQTYLPEDLLVKMDRATMAHSLEARSPLLDHVLAGFASTLSEPQLFDDAGVGKSILRTAYRDVLPAPILQRDKMGFGVPLGSWLRNELRPHVDELLLSDAGPLWTWFRSETVRPLVRGMLDGDDGAIWQTWNLLALAGWIDANHAI